MHHFCCLEQLLFFIFLKFFLKILFIHERHTQRERQRHRQREKQAPFREPDLGLDPWSPGSGPGLKAALNRCATWAAPEQILKQFLETGWYILGEAFDMVISDFGQKFWRRYFIRF